MEGKHAFNPKTEILVGNTIRRSAVDYIFTSGKLPFLHCRQVGKCGSDHYPLMVSFNVPWDRYRPLVVDS